MAAVWPAAHAQRRSRALTLCPRFACQAREQLGEAAASPDAVPRAASCCPSVAAAISPLRRGPEVRASSTQEQPCKPGRTFLKLPQRSRCSSLGCRKRWPPDCWCHRVLFSHYLLPHPTFCPSLPRKKMHQ